MSSSDRGFVWVVAILCATFVSCEAISAFAPKAKCTPSTSVTGGN